MTNVEKMERGVNDLRAILSVGGECSLVDVREYPEFAAGRIREARLIQLGEIERRAEEINTCAMGLLLARMPWNRDANTGAEACPVERVHAEE